MSFFWYDISFLVLFGIATFLFLHKRRKNLKREGLLYLYRTQVGIRFIDKINEKFGNIIAKTRWIVIVSGYFLMLLGLALVLQVVYIFYKFPEVVKAVKVPPITPLIPYLPSIFKIDFLPPLYFTYFIIIIAVIAIPHEFFHGIFARISNVKIKSTGFGFLGPFLAAFVEPDEDELKKRKKRDQLAMLAAGSFANLLLTILFFFIMFGFFAVFYAPSGVSFYDNSYSLVNITSITQISNFVLANPSPSTIKSISSQLAPDLTLDINGGFNLTRISVNEKSYYAQTEKLSQINEGSEMITLYDDFPALSSGILLAKYAIVEMDGKKISNLETFTEEISKKSPNQEITLKIEDKKTEETRLVKLNLAESPQDSEKPYLGAVAIGKRSQSIFAKAISFLTFFRDQNTYYKPLNDIEFFEFIYDLLYWLVFINMSIAFLNMLPFGIFDGGRVFYLTALAVFGTETRAQKAYKIATMFILGLLVLSMIFWFTSMFF